MNKGRPKRRPLIQGKLVIPDSSSDISALGSSQADNRNDVELDPTLSPRRLVPQLTEKASPRPEPPSSCLDLSDVDLDVKEASSTNFHHRGNIRPVMVYDASEPVKDSPESCEMSLSVGIEASPARVVCHTPSRFEKIRNSPRPALSPLAVTVNVSATDREGSKFKPDRLSRTLFPDGDDDEKTEADEDEVQFKMTTNESGLRISHQSRGIIEEILAHEMGDSNIEKVSLHSQSCSPVAQISSAGQPSSSIFSASISSQSKEFDDSSSLRPKQKSTDDSDDAGSISGKYSVNTKKRGVSSTSESTDPVFIPPSGNEPPTRVKPKKKVGRQVASRYMESAVNRKANISSNSQHSSKSSTASPSVSTPTKQKNTVTRKTAAAGKAVPERLAPQRKESRPTSAAHGKSKTGKGGTLRTGLTIKHSMDLDQKNLQKSRESPQPLSVRGEAVGGGTGTEVKASTPVGDQPCAMSYIDASAIQSTTNMFAHATTLQFDTMMEESIRNDDMTKAEYPGNALKQSVPASRGAGDGGEGQKVTQFDLDIAFARYLQWQFLLGRARQAFGNQQQQASAQLHGLWQLTEARRQEVAQLEMDVARLRSMVLLDEVLDKTEQELSPLVDSLPTVSSEYNQLATALDSTCHQLPVTDIYLPPGGEQAREAMEERMAGALTEAEHILTEINAVGKRDGQDLQQDLSQYVACLAALEKTSSATAEELQLCRQGLEEARSLNTRLASLQIQDRQSNS